MFYICKQRYSIKFYVKILPLGLQNDIFSS